MKKFAALLLVLVLTMTMTMMPAVMAEEASIWNLENTIFPLEEPVTFTILSSGYRYAALSTLAENEDWQALCKATNVNFEFEFLGDYDAPEARSNLQNRLMGENYGEAIMSFYIDTLSQADIAELGGVGILLPLDDYLSNPELMPNFYENVYSKLPHVLNNMKSVDGNIYSFQGVTELAGYTAGEALLQVNEAWLNAWKTARDVENSPATLAEFEDMLVFFRDSDLNGNGQKDEIPYMMAQSTYSGTATVEHAMGMFGISTKDSALDMNLMIDNDQVYYAHTTQNYKDALKTFAAWYKEDLIWEEVFTANAETINNEFAMATSKIGVVNTNVSMDGFVTILPPAVEGYEARYHMHPALRASLAQPFTVITNKCENPEVLAAFIDLGYNFENSLVWRYGSDAFANGKITVNEEGKYVFHDGLAVSLPPAKGEAVDKDRALYDIIWGIELGTLELFNKYVDMDSYYGENASVKGHQLFTENGIWNPTGSIWPRCTIPEEYAEDYAFMLTDVSAVLTEYRAKFITGQLDVDAEWDNFQNKMKKLGIEEMVEIAQKAYDAYLGK